ncbi:MAG: hypothetical protein LBT62_04600 [Deltaproteobacteria bacterium]|nr:hypothetical protein [Deltaproteobacteria bacterium]
MERVDVFPVDETSGGRRQRSDVSLNYIGQFIPPETPTELPAKFLAEEQKRLDAKLRKNAHERERYRQRKEEMQSINSSAPQPLSIRHFAQSGKHMSGLPALAERCEY